MVGIYTEIEGGRIIGTSTKPWAVEQKANVLFEQACIAMLDVNKRKEIFKSRIKELETSK